MRATSGIPGTWTTLLMGLVTIGALATFVALPPEPAFAERIVGTSGADRIVGTKKPDLNAVDGQKDRAVNGGPGNDVCTIDKADLPVVKYCNTVKVVNSGGGGVRVCVVLQEDKLQASRASRGLRAQAGPTFSPAFYDTTITLNADADGLDDSGNLPISINQVCDVPKSLATEALQIAGGDGVAVIGPGTQVFQAGKLLQGQAATTAVAGADTVAIRARLKHPGEWGQDDEGNPVPTFTASRITITD